MEKNQEHETTEKSLTEEQFEFEQRPMVGWYDARQLLGTAIKTVISSVFGAYSDKREIQAALSDHRKYDYSEMDEVWIDYMSDTGDGFHSTFTMASLLSEEKRNIDGYETFKGNILVLGGDQVYPVATREEYKNRLRGPFDAACRNLKEQGLIEGLPAAKERHLYAVPGNHDWYDGLTNFIKIFCQNRTIGNWLTKQQRSYFAIKLPHNWWLWGIDIQLEADIDYPQLKYFDEIANTEMAPGDKIILCTAEPSWIFTTRKKDHTYDNLKFFEQRYIVEKGFELVLSIAGDLHHYAHYSLSKNGKEYHKLTSGGGGAFLHPTHNLKEKLALREGEFVLQKTFPSKGKSRKLAYWNLAFPWVNFQFALFMGAFYLLFSWMLQEATKSNDITFIMSISKLEPSPGNLSRFLGEVATIIKFNPLIALTIAIIIFGVYKFTDTNSSKLKYLGIVGLVHGIIHIMNGFLLIWVFASLIPPSTIGRITLFSLGIFAVGGITGCLVMGIYLFLTNMLFGIHDNEAFSSIKWSGYKNFIRMHITKDVLTIYPVGVDKTAKWKKEGKRYIPDREVKTKLADSIITINNKKYEEATSSIPVFTNN